jgi:hypothetical protein
MCYVLRECKDKIAIEAWKDFSPATVLVLRHFKIMQLELEGLKIPRKTHICDM